MTSEPICDFCGSRDPVWWYEARDAAMLGTLNPEGGGTLQVSRGNWAACRLCAELIDRHEPEALAQRSFNLSTMETLSSHIKRRVIESAHFAFWRGRTGARHPIKA